MPRCFKTLLPATVAVLLVFGFFPTQAAAQAEVTGIIGYLLGSDIDPDPGDGISRNFESGLAWGVRGGYSSKTIRCLAWKVASHKLPCPILMLVRTHSPTVSLTAISTWSYKERTRTAGLTSRLDWESLASGWVLPMVVRPTVSWAPTSGLA